jgi:hypothetical protein
MLRSVSAGFLPVYTSKVQTYSVFSSHISEVLIPYLWDLIIGLQDGICRPVISQMGFSHQAHVHYGCKKYSVSL